MSSTVYSRTFQKAAELAGGQKKLARQLHVPLSDLEKWIAGTGEPPMAIFLRAVDIVLEETSPPASDTGDPAAPQDCAGVGGSSVLL